jgi:nitrate reductase NapAB chaperone NapD
MTPTKLQKLQMLETVSGILAAWLVFLAVLAYALCNGEFP